MELNNIEQRRP